MGQRLTDGAHDRLQAHLHNSVAHDKIKLHSASFDNDHTQAELKERRRRQEEVVDARLINARLLLQELPELCKFVGHTGEYIAGALHPTGQQATKGTRRARPAKDSSPHDRSASAGKWGHNKGLPRGNPLRDDATQSFNDMVQIGALPI